MASFLCYFSVALVHIQNGITDNKRYPTCSSHVLQPLLLWTLRMPVGNELVETIKVLKWKIQQNTKLPAFNFSGYNGNWLDKIV